MNTKTHSVLRHITILLMTILITLSPNGNIRFAKAEEPAVKKFQLYATDGYLTLPDGVQVYIWGYSLTNEKGSAVYPAPTLEVNEGEWVEVILTNIGPKKAGIKRLAHTIHWHGMDTDQKNDGVPHTSAAIQVGESYTYRFMAKHAGTYFYHCHVDTIEHLQMGMHGAFIVSAKDGAKQAWTDGPAYDKEYVFELNEIDPIWHKAVEEGKPYDRTTFHPTFWTINGKAFPDTEQDPTTMIEGTVGQTVLIRMINAGYQPHSFHMHGYHFQVIATDGRPLPEPLDKDTILIGPGERYDVLVKFDQSGMFPFHSHNIVDNTNNGVYPGGLHTMIEVGEQTPPPTMKSFTMKVGRTTIDVNGSIVKVPNPPANMQGTTYVPLRFIVEQLGSIVKWIPSEQSIIYTTTATNVQLWLNKKQAKVDGKVMAISAPLKKINETVMVPIGILSEQLGGTVKFKVETGEIVLTAAIASASHHDHSDTGGSIPEPSGTGANIGQSVVEITKSAFIPKKLTIKKGQTVKWVNKDTQIHTVFDLGDAFASKNLLRNDNFVYTFKDTGTYIYYCSTHPTMEGEITVTD